MIIQLSAFALFAVFLFFRARLVDQTSTRLDKETTATINGFFICIVFLSHFSQYCVDVYPNAVGRLFRQLMVATFLFFSGYGCAAQYRRRGGDYLDGFLSKRILTTLANFDIAVCVFVVVGFLLGKRFPLRQIILSFVGWDSVGNSSWYIFAILLCYTTFWIAFKICGKKRISDMTRSLGCVAIVGCAVLVLSRVKDQPCWYDTMMVFPAGVMYSLYRERIERFLAKYYWPCLALLSVAFATVTHLPVVGSRHWASFNLKSICFALIVVLVTMKVELRSPALRWCGEHLFPIYIYQRIPMIIFSTLHPAAFMDWRCWIYGTVSFGITILIASQYRRFKVG